MDVRSLYQSKLTVPDQAVASIPSGSKLSMGMAMAEPPALLKALADRAGEGRIEDLKVYYFESTRIAGETILRYELIDRIRPYCMFISGTERALIKRGVEDGGRKVINYVPNNFHQTPRLLIDEIGIDTFVCTVSPMDRHGYFSFGTGNDYSTKVARAAKRLMRRNHGCAPTPLAGSLNVEPRPLGDIANTVGRTDQDRGDQAEPRGLGSALQRDFVTGMRDSRRHRGRLCAARSSRS